MGTSYQITLLSTRVKANQIHQQVETRLKTINQLMSTYIDDSELSIFNRSLSLDCQVVSSETYLVVKNALTISEQTQGKFDVTISPLIAEWGFDKKQTDNVIPSEETINKLLTEVGYNNIVLGDECIQKKTPHLSINLSAIAKGYGVDQIAALLQNNEITDYLVEIGGETASKGVNPQSVSWRLAVEAPVEQYRKIQQVFTPLGLGVATSGDYRNYFEKDGLRYSHTIDPSNGKPVTHKLASVTVLHPQTMLADAYATAFTVMGEKSSLDFANKNEMPVYLLVKTETGFKTVYSEAFAKHLILTDNVR